MKQRGKNYSTEEDKYIISKIEENLGNLDMAFRQISEHLSRSYGSVKNRWYKYLSKADHNNPANIAFVTYSKKQNNINRKVVRDSVQQLTRLVENKNLWKRIITWIVRQ